MNRLKQRRNELGLKQSEFEEKFNFGKGTISQYERGERYPQDMSSLAKALGVYEKWLTGESDIKDYQDAIQNFTSKITSIDSIKDRLRLYKGLMAFTESLGYEIEFVNNETWSISTTEYTKYIGNSNMNNLIESIITYTQNQLDSISNDEELENSLDAVRENTDVSDCLNNDYTYVPIIKGGDAND